MKTLLAITLLMLSYNTLAEDRCPMPASEYAGDEKCEYYCKISTNGWCGKKRE